MRRWFWHNIFVSKVRASNALKTIIGATLISFEATCIRRTVNLCNHTGSLNETFNDCDGVEKVINNIVAIIRNRVNSSVQFLQ